MDLSLLAVAARLVVGLMFVVIGLRLLLGRSLVAALLATKRIPAPAFVALAGGVIEILLGLLMIAGVMPAYVAIAMAVFVVVATIMVHDFWHLKGQRRALEINTVLTHMLVVGGLLCMAAYPW
ncbi:putative oxidoreductase [Kaistia hirudinis]|uniref:Putative oxidoreductase n=1 Tax=Kaistia hirudinis TaxID=1293440 RepID=A0A840AFU9_9HYPH|nr:DoxX family protein [Kaistia hirudinis]MBB3929239.1 putative oxidoreductase [Kaistia hirudinis]